MLVLASETAVKKKKKCLGPCKALLSYPFMWSMETLVCVLLEFASFILTKHVSKALNFFFFLTAQFVRSITMYSVNCAQNLLLFF